MRRSANLSLSVSCTLHWFNQCWHPQALHSISFSINHQHQRHHGKLSVSALAVTEELYIVCAGKPNPLTKLQKHPCTSYVTPEKSGQVKRLEWVTLWLEFQSCTCCHPSNSSTTSGSGCANEIVCECRGIMGRAGSPSNFSGTTRESFSKR